MGHIMCCPFTPSVNIPGLYKYNIYIYIYPGFYKHTDFDVPLLSFDIDLYHHEDCSLIPTMLRRSMRTPTTSRMYSMYIAPLIETMSARSDETYSKGSRTLSKITAYNGVELHHPAMEFVQQGKFKTENDEALFPRHMAHASQPSNSVNIPTSILSLPDKGRSS